MGNIFYNPTCLNNLYATPLLLHPFSYSPLVVTFSLKLISTQGERAINQRLFIIRDNKYQQYKTDIHFRIALLQNDSEIVLESWNNTGFYHPCKIVP